MKDGILVIGGPVDGGTFTPPQGRPVPLELYAGRLPVTGYERTVLVLSPRPFERDGHGRDYYRLAASRQCAGALAYLWYALDWRAAEWVTEGAAG